MLKIPKNPELIDVEMEFEEDVAEKLKAFEEYTQQVQGQEHATLGLCVRAIMEKDLSSTRWDGFHAWRRGEAEDLEGPSDASESGVDEPERAEASEEPADKVENQNTKQEEAEGQEGSQKARPFGVDGADATGPVKVEDKREPEPKGSHSEGASATGARRITRETK
jgi:hypothetical protein